MKRYQGTETDNPQAKSRGFTLIEMAVILVILGLIAGSVLPLLETVIKKDKISETKSIVKTARDELVGYILLNKKLPADQSAFLSQIGHTVDAWQQNLFYIPTWDSNATINLCSMNSTKFSVCRNGNCSASKIPNILFLVGSKGGNLNRQTESPANRDADTTDGEVRIYNYSVKVDGYSSGSDPNRPQDNYDDMVEFVQLNEIKSKLTCP